MGVSTAHRRYFFGICWYIGEIDCISELKGADPERRAGQVRAREYGFLDDDCLKNGMLEAGVDEGCPGEDRKGEIGVAQISVLQRIRQIGMVKAGVREVGALQVRTSPRARRRVGPGPPLGGVDGGVDEMARARPAHDARVQRPPIRLPGCSHSWNGVAYGNFRRPGTLHNRRLLLSDYSALVRGRLCGALN